MAKDYVKNELGHTEYPKWIDHPSDKTPNGFPRRVLVATPEDEANLSGGKKPSTKAAVDPNSGFK